jgi:hypothetical protein
MRNVELLAGDPHPNESRKAILACNDFLRMGPGRALIKLAERYQAAGDDDQAPPTRSHGLLRKWSHFFDWPARATDYDARQDLERTRLAEERRREAMETGLALDYERVIALKKLAKKLKGYLSEHDRVWLRDYKGLGENMHEIERFNAPLIDQYRGTLEDLAKERGERKQKTEISGPDGKPIETSAKANYTKLTTQELRELASLLAKAESDNPTDA